MLCSLVSILTWDLRKFCVWSSTCFFYTVLSY